MSLPGPDVISWSASVEDSSVIAIHNLPSTDKSLACIWRCMRGGSDAPGQVQRLPEVPCKSGTSRNMEQ